MLTFILALFLQAQGPVDEIRAGKGFVHVPLGIYELTETLLVPSGVTILCEPGAVFEAAQGAFLGVNDSLVRMENSTNVSIHNCTFRGRKADYLQPPYEPSEYRHVIEMVGAVSIRFYDVRVESGGGDGIIIRSFISCPFSECRKPSQDITIDRLTATDNYRNGVSITSAVNVVIRDSVVEGTKGTAPQAGICIEPDHGGDRMENIRIEGVLARGNGGSAFMVNMDRQNEHSMPISITFKCCIGHDIPNGHHLIRVLEYGANQKSKKPLGFVRFDKSQWVNP